MTNQILPYQNKSLADIPGEEWKDVPGFEGTYQASTMGRVKSLDRIVPHPRLYQQSVKGQILSQKVNQNQNLKTGDPSIYLSVTFSIEGQPKCFNTRRVIYQTFIDPKINYQDDGLYVINIDGDGYNNRLENLQLATKREKSQRAFARDRVPVSILKTADRTHWRKNYSNSKPVEQYDLKGNFIKEYPSIREASRQLQLDDKAIIQVAKGLYRQWNGYVWKYKKNECRPK